MNRDGCEIGIRFAPPVEKSWPVLIAGQPELLDGNPIESADVSDILQ